MWLMLLPSFATAQEPALAPRTFALSHGEGLTQLMKAQGCAQFSFGHVAEVIRLSALERVRDAWVLPLAQPVVLPPDCSVRPTAQDAARSREILSRRAPAVDALVTTTPAPQPSRVDWKTDAPVGRDTTTEVTIPMAPGKGFGVGALALAFAMGCLFMAGVFWAWSARRAASDPAPSPAVLPAAYDAVLDGFRDAHSVVQLRLSADVHDLAVHDSRLNQWLEQSRCASKPMPELVASSAARRRPA